MPKTRRKKKKKKGKTRKRLAKYWIYEGLRFKSYLRKINRMRKKWNMKTN